jgi:preprotein translocase subunit SecD
MDRAWTWKAGFIVAVALAAVYALVPSWTYFKLPAQTRNEAGVFDAARPKWAPHRHLNLGLDLQGGIHLVMGVEVERAVREKAVRRAEELSADLERREIKGAQVRGDPDTGIVTVSAKDPGVLSKARSQVSDDYPDMFVRSSSGDNFALAMKDQAIKQLKESAVDQAVKAIRNRVDKWGVSEPTIAKRGDSNILVQLPGYSNPEKAKELIGRTAQLEFKIVDDEDTSLSQVQGKLPDGVTLDFESSGDTSVATPFLRSKNRQLLAQVAAQHTPPGKDFGIGKYENRLKNETGYRTYLLDKKAGLTGEYITDARVAFDSQPGEGNRPYVMLTFNGRGADLFGKLTTANVHKRMAIVLDDTVDSAPVIQTPITEGNCRITLGGLKPINEILEEAKDLALVLKSGALPAPVRILEERSVGASLGPELIRKGTLAAVVGLLAVLAFMAFYYRFSGVVADVALALNGLLVLAIMALIDSTLTLPGIAGFVLTLGMAVDANVLINERIREELKTGKSVAAAIATGYDKVFWTIFDGHVTALIAGFVIRTYGSGPVRGFATTLIIGLFASMFTSIVVTRAIVDWFVGHGKLNKAVSF